MQDRLSTHRICQTIQQSTRKRLESNPHVPSNPGGTSGPCRWDQRIHQHTHRYLPRSGLKGYCTTLDIVLQHCKRRLSIQHDNGKGLQNILRVRHNCLHNDFHLQIVRLCRRRRGSSCNPAPPNQTHIHRSHHCMHRVLNNLSGTHPVPLQLSD